MFEAKSHMHGFHVHGAPVGHVPQKASCMCWLFLRHGGSKPHIIMGNKSEDLPQSGMEVPCLLKFDGPEEIRGQSGK